MGEKSCKGILRWIIVRVLIVPDILWSDPDLIEIIVSLIIIEQGINGIMRTACDLIAPVL